MTIATTGSDTNHHRYGGKYGYYTDGANGIILAGLRWYHPAIMRWLTRDPIQYEGGTNMYAYVGGNPVRYVDPTGLSPWDFHSQDHGGPHFQRSGPGNVQQRYRSDNFEPLRHRGSYPPSLSPREIEEIKRSSAYKKWIRWKEAYLRNPTIAPPRWQLRCLGMLAGVDLFIQSMNGDLLEQFDAAYRAKICHASPALCEIQ